MTLSYGLAGCFVPTVVLLPQTSAAHFRRARGGNILSLINQLPTGRAHTQAMPSTPTVKGSLSFTKQDR